MKYLLPLILIVLSSCAHQTESTSQPAPIIEEESVVAEVFETPKTIEQAIASPYRTPQFKERDKYRHPGDTLTFFRVKSSMKVLEITPETGWYTEILAPFLNDKGQYLMATHPEGSPAPQSSNIEEWSKKYPSISKNIKVTTFDLSNPALELGEEGSLDMVVTFRNIHNWMAQGKADIAFKAFFKVLRKGGVLGVVEHRAPVDRIDPKAPTGYVRESDVMRMAKKAGLKYVGKSAVNSNPKDTKDHEKGVWSLPPTLTLKEKDREKYMAIGESDRMTLKFIKP
jgi:predicted methyltransferase